MKYENVFTEVDKLVPRYADKEAVLLPALHLVQREEGYISDEAIRAIAEYLELPSVRVEKVVTFYTMFRQKPLGKYFLQLCTNISCSLLGADTLLSHLESNLGIKLGETTEDGLFTLGSVECLGACGTAPVMQVNDDYYENLSIERVDEILASLRKEADV